MNVAQHIKVHNMVVTTFSTKEVPTAIDDGAASSGFNPVNMVITVYSIHTLTVLYNNVLLIFLIIVS